MATTNEIIKYIMNTPENTNPGILRELLNEHGGGGSDMLIVNVVQDDDTSEPRLDRTWQEIHDAIGRVVIHDEFSDEGVVKLYSTINIKYSPANNAYGVSFGASSDYVIMVTSSPDGYPVYFNPATVDDGGAHTL